MYMYLPNKPNQKNENNIDMIKTTKIKNKKKKTKPSQSSFHTASNLNLIPSSSAFNNNNCESEMQRN